MSLLALVVQPLVPLMKQMASMIVMMVAAVRFLVAWSINSEIGIPVDVDMMEEESAKQNSMTIMKKVPLSWLAVSLSTYMCISYVTPPTAMA